MIGYQPVALRLGHTPNFYPVPGGLNVTARLAQNDPLTKAKAKSVLAASAVVGLTSLAITAGGTWVGIRTGIKEKGFLSFTGWIVGIASGLGAAANLGVLAVSLAALVGLKDLPLPEAPAASPGTMI